jgi:hypothetical protein
MTKKERKKNWNTVEKLEEIRSGVVGWVGQCSAYIRFVEGSPCRLSHLLCASHLHLHASLVEEPSLLRRQINLRKGYVSVLSLGLGRETASRSSVSPLGCPRIVVATTKPACSLHNWEGRKLEKYVFSSRDPKVEGDSDIIYRHQQYLDSVDASDGTFSSAISLLGGVIMGCAPPSLARVTAAFWCHSLFGVLFWVGAH